MEQAALINDNPYANGSVIFTQNGHYAREFVRHTNGFRFYTENKVVTSRWFDEETANSTNVSTWDGTI